MSDVKKVHTKLGEFFATTICGNDILSSALYVSGIAAVFAGAYAPFVLFAVACVLVLYRSVYREVVEALPVNGGAYNALLNATSKVTAAFAGVMTILSYTATSVISAKTAVEYLFTFFEKLLPLTQLNISVDQLHAWTLPAVILVLGAFALLVIAGVKDSARVAAGIFVFHVITLTVFAIVGLTYAFLLHVDLHAANAAATQAIVQSHHGLWPTLFLAFSACLLGVSGFESSANFVEEQAPGVFKKTLRNMTLGVLVFNPLIAQVVLSVLNVNQIVQAKDFVLATAAYQIGGLFFLGWIAINAFLVLCGAVLTGYIGVSGLIYRMSLDDCLPVFLAKRNVDGSHPRIIIAFFLLCSSILFLTRGDLLSLAGVYTISFLGVMTMFAAANLILRQTRPDLKRPYRAPTLVVILAFSATLAGLVGNLLIDSRNAVYFLLYFIPAIALAMAVIFRRNILHRLERLLTFIPVLRRKVLHAYERTANARLYVFLHHTGKLFRTLKYINDNENGQHITIVHCKLGDRGQREEIQHILPELEKAGVFPHFNIDYAYIDQVFSPATVDQFSRTHHVPKNRIFIGSIHSHHEFFYDDFGGVRIIS